MKVKLISYTPDPEKLVAMAAKLCYSAVGTDEIAEGLTPEATAKFLDFLTGIGHESPIEHVNFTFAAEGISRTLTHQLVRHRIASYSQQSQRYVKLDAFEYVMPPAIEAIPLAKAYFEEAMARDQESYDKLVDILENAAFGRLIQEGVPEKQARKGAEKAAIEDARYVFPNACETKILFTMNARTLLHFFSHRCCNRAQWEIRQMADLMLVEARKAAPLLFGHAGPGCMGGSCPEKTMTCGKMKQVVTRYRSENLI